MFVRATSGRGESGSPSTRSPRSSGQAGQAGLPFGRLRASRTPKAGVSEKKGSATRLADLKFGHYTRAKNQPEGPPLQKRRAIATWGRKSPPVHPAKTAEWRGDCKRHRKGLPQPQSKRRWHKSQRYKYTYSVAWFRSTARSKPGASMSACTKEPQGSQKALALRYRF